MLHHNGAPAAGRRSTSIGFILGVLAVMTAALGVRAQAPGPEINIYRFWRAPDITQVEAFVQVPWGALTFVRTGTSELARYTGTLEVRDSAGLVLTRQSWIDSVQTSTVAPELRSRVSSNEHFVLRLKPGAYSFAVTVRDSAGRKDVEARQTVQAFRARPARSDVVLAASIARVPADSDRTAGGIQRGAMLIVPNVQGAITPDKPDALIFAEIYRGGAGTDTAQAVISLAGEREFSFRTPPQRRIFGAGGGADALATKLAGLPPGSYDLAVRWAFPGDTVIGHVPLHMLPPGAGTVPIASANFYAGKTEAQLDSLIGPLHYLATPAEATELDMLSGPDAKARYLGQFFARHAAAQGTTAQDLRKEFEGRLQYANREFASASRKTNRPGWQTDRGRLYILMGRPAETLVQRQAASMQSHPWEAWKYATGRGDKYLFVDLTGFGDYELVYTTNPYMPQMSSGNWQQYFTQEDVQRISSF